MKRLFCLFLSLASITWCGNSEAAPFKGKRNAEGLTFSRLVSIGSVEPQVIGGKVVTAALFPASFFASFGNGPSPATCTATLIGPRVVLTAAHCVGHGKKIRIRANGKVYTGPCYHHKDYPDDESADFAVCSIKRSIPGIKAERVSSVSLKVNDTVLLAGYGCITPKATGGNDGSFQAGLSVVSQVAGMMPTPNYYQTNGLKDASKPAAVCMGDSGGAVFCLDKNENPSGRRVVCGINSAVDCVGFQGENCVKVSKTSYLSSPNKYLNWMQTVQPKPICGLNPSIEALCRD